MGRPKKYTAKKLREQVDAYFDSISRVTPVLIPEPTGEFDRFGHEVVRMVPAVNRLGEEMTRIEYLIPPSVGGLCEYLGIHRDTWAEYSDHEAHPEFSDTTMRARGRMQAWNEEQLLTRSGRDCKGIIFNLENNYGYREKLDVQSRDKTVEEFLAEMGGGGGF